MPSISTPSGQSNRVFATNATTTTYPTIADGTATPATNDGVINVAGKNECLMSFFGTDADDEDFAFQVIGWWEGALSWKPHRLVVGTAVLSADVGVTGGDVLSTERYADTITRTSGISVPTISTFVANQRSVMRFDLLGANLLQVIFDLDAAGSAAASANAIAILI